MQASNRHTKHRWVLLRLNCSHLLASLTRTYKRSYTCDWSGHTACGVGAEPDGGTGLADEPQKDDVSTDGERQPQIWEEGFPVI